MAQSRTDGDLNLERRKEIFLALVEAQDQPMSVVQSRKLVGERFDLDDRQCDRLRKRASKRNGPRCEREPDTLERTPDAG